MLEYENAFLLAFIHPSMHIQHAQQQHNV